MRTRGVAVLLVVTAGTLAACSGGGLIQNTARRSIATTSTTTSTPAQARRLELLHPADDVWFRLSLQESETSREISLDTAGQLVDVAPVNIYMSPAGGTVRRVTTDGTARILAMISASGILDGDNTRWGDIDYNASGTSAGLFHSGCCVAEAHGLFEPHAGLTKEEQRLRHSFETVISRLRDLTWLGDDVGDPLPWMPSAITAYVQPIRIDAAPPVGAPVAWPLPGRILDRADGTIDRPYTDNAPYLCLTGADAAAVWQMLGNGTNTAWLPVDDGTGPVFLSLDVGRPGYRLHGNPCP